MQDVVLITGGSAGIGAELARSFAARGHALLLVARSGERLAAIAAELADRHAVAVHALAVDLTAPAALDDIDAFLAARGLRVHTLVNCAGWGRIGPFAGQDVGDIPDMIDLNCKRLAETCHRYLPQIIQARGGILNVASVAGFLPGPGMSVYFASKAFVVSLTQALAHELAPLGVRVSALCPGPSPTRFQARAGMHGGRSRPMLTLNPDVIAQVGVAGYLAGRTLIIPGLWNKVLVLGGKFIIHRLLMPLVARYHRLNTGRGLRGAVSPDRREAGEPAEVPVRDR